MATPPRLIHLQCRCGTSHWELDCDHRGMGPSPTYEARAYLCPGCGREDTGYTVLEKSPSEFLLQPHPSYPMSAADFEHWVEVLRTHFPDHWKLRDLGKEWVPYTGPASDPRSPTEQEMERAMRQLADFRASLSDGHSLRTSGGDRRDDTSGDPDPDRNASAGVPGPRTRVRLEIAAIFAAVGLGALAVTLLYDPMALVPQPPFGRWIFVRILALCSLASLGLLLVLDIEDDFDVDPPDRPIYWRVIGLAFLVSALASATFIAVSALVEYLDRTIA